MAFVQRANVILEVKDDAVERMRDMGYSVVDEYGNVLQESNVKTVGGLEKDVAGLEAICNKQKEIIEALEVKCEELKKEVAALRKASKSSNRKK